MTHNVINNFPFLGPVQTIFVTGAGSTVNSTSPTDMVGSSITITPTSASNNVLIIASFEISTAGAPAGNQVVGLMQCLRGASVINGSPAISMCNILTGSAGNQFTSVSFLYMDSPATTSATTYKFQQYLNGFATGLTSANGTIILLEVPVSPATLTTQNMVNDSNPGTVVQVQYAIGATSSTSSTSPTNITGSSVNITPTSASNNILVLANFGFYSNIAGSGVANNYFQMVRGSTVIGGTPYSQISQNQSGTSTCAWEATNSFWYLDSPNTTSTLTYVAQQYAGGGGSVAQSSNGAVVVMEIGA